MQMQSKNAPLYVFEYVHSSVRVSNPVPASCSGFWMDHGDKHVISVAFSNPRAALEGNGISTKPEIPGVTTLSSSDQAGSHNFLSLSFHPSQPFP